MISKSARSILLAIFVCVLFLCVHTYLRVALGLGGRLSIGFEAGLAAVLLCAACCGFYIVSGKHTYALSAFVLATGIVIGVVIVDGIQVKEKAKATEEIQGLANARENAALLGAAVEKLECTDGATAVLSDSTKVEGLSRRLTLAVVPVDRRTPPIFLAFSNPEYKAPPSSTGIIAFLERKQIECRSGNYSSLLAVMPALTDHYMTQRRLRQPVSGGR